VDNREIQHSREPSTGGKVRKKAINKARKVSHGRGKKKARKSERKQNTRSRGDGLVLKTWFNHPGGT